MAKTSPERQLTFTRIDKPTYEAMKGIAQRSRRPLSVEIAIAVEEYVQRALAKQARREARTA